MERDRLRFEPIELSFSTRVRSRQTFLRSEIEQIDAIGNETARHPAIENSDFLGAELTPASLIGDGGLPETICHDDCSGGESGNDHFAHELRTRSHVRAQLGPGSQRARFIEQEIAQPLAELGASRFAHGEDAMSSIFQPARREGGLRRLARSFDSFEGDKQSFSRPVHDSSRRPPGARSHGARDAVAG